MSELYDIAIIGGGISGFSTALRLQAKGFKTIVIEAHGQIGGCAGFFTKKGFSFDVGATTLVDFEKGGVGANFFADISLIIPNGEYLDYCAWLPDIAVTLYRDKEKWQKERLEKLGSTKQHIAFWRLMDDVTEVFWNAVRKGIKLPIQNWHDIVKNIQSVGVRNIYLLKYLNVTMLDILKKFNLEKDKVLVGFLSMLVEDTVHTTIDKAPFINAALGTTIRGAGLMRAKGGMRQFWKQLAKHYIARGGVIKVGAKAKSFKRSSNYWVIETCKSFFTASKLVCSLPIDLTNQIAPLEVKQNLKKHIQKNKGNRGGAIVLFLGVKDEDVEGHKLTHHQLLQDYDSSLGNGNNMFISISAKGDILSAPVGYRSVMISTHCSIEEWKNLSEEDYKKKKEELGSKLIQYARRVYPELGKTNVIFEIGTPRTYQKFTNRHNGFVGGFSQVKNNSNQYAIPHNIGVKDFWMIGDDTWPGLGTVAGLVASRIVTESIIDKK